MNQKTKDEWLEKLRSGEYKQCKRSLYDGEGYCCVGIYGLVKGMEVPELDIDNENEQKDTATRIYKSLAYELEESAKDVYNPKEHLINMNDRGISFAEIADWIESNVHCQEEGVSTENTGT